MERNVQSFSRVAGEAEIVLKTGLPRLVRHAEEVALKVHAHRRRPYMELTRAVALVPGAEALAVLVQLDKDERSRVLSEAGANAHNLALLLAMLNEAGDPTDKDSAAYALRGLMPDITIRPRDTDGRSAPLPSNQIVLAFEGRQLSVYAGEKTVLGGSFDWVRNSAMVERFQWYLETYSSHRIGEQDDLEGARVKSELRSWGEQLFLAVFHSPHLRSIYRSFLNGPKQHRILTVAADNPEILALPWELIAEPASPHGFLLRAPYNVSIRRVTRKTRISPFASVHRNHLRILWITSRPRDSGFVDPRNDAEAMLDGIDMASAANVSVEFLRPPTLDRLRQRLSGQNPAVDVIHFDGAGIYDIVGDLAQRAGSGKRVSDTEARPDTGYLLFETSAGSTDFVSADRLEGLLSQLNLPLFVIARGETGTGTRVSEGDQSANRSLGSVAVRLLEGGVHSVVTLNQALLPPRSATFFREFYRSIAAGGSVTDSLASGRRALRSGNNGLTHHVKPERIPPTLEDWFVPILFQGQTDAGLVIRRSRKSASRLPGADLPPPPEGGFFGRRRESLEIERLFTKGVRCVEIVGLAGIGKSTLAAESARWLLKTGMFDTAAFIDLRHEPDPNRAATSVVRPAVRSSADSNICADPENNRTLLILDDFDAIPEAMRPPIVDQVCGIRTDACEARVIVTSRHASAIGALAKRSDYAILNLVGLSPDEAMAWSTALLHRSPTVHRPLPAPEQLERILAYTRFHPLSIRLVVDQLRRQTVDQLLPRLNAILAGDSPFVRRGSETWELRASFRELVNGLSMPQRTAVEQLAAFAGGGFEPELKSVVGLPDSEWSEVRNRLQNAGLINIENLAEFNAPFVTFHPLFNALIEEHALPSIRALAAERHAARYRELAKAVYQYDASQPGTTRELAKRELPNFLRALNVLIESEDETAPPFAGLMVDLLSKLGNVYEVERIVARIADLPGRHGARGQFLVLSSWGDALFSMGRLSDAESIFTRVLGLLKTKRGYDYAVTLARLARVHRASGKRELAEAALHEANNVSQDFPDDEKSERLKATLKSDLGGIHADQGNYEEARALLSEAIQIHQRAGNERDAAATIIQIAQVAAKQGHYAEATTHLQASLQHFRSLGEPSGEANAWNLLGEIHESARQFPEAERSYRLALEIMNDIRHDTDSVRLHNQLGRLNDKMGNTSAAEHWYRTAVRLGSEIGDGGIVAASKLRLAAQLTERGEKLDEALVLAESALAAVQKLPEGENLRAELHSVLSRIALLQSARTNDADVSERLQKVASMHRRQSQEIFRRSAAFEEHRKSFEVLIQGVAAVCLGNSSHMPAVKRSLEAMAEAGGGWTECATAMQRLLAGERNYEALVEKLHPLAAALVGAALEVIQNSRKLDPGEGTT